MSEMSQQATIKMVNAAILAIMAEIGTVTKDGTNKFQNYKYVKAADIDAKLQPLMAKHGLIVIQTEVDRNLIDNGSTLEIVYNFHVQHISGDTLMFPLGPIVPRRTGMAAARNSKGGFDDKAANKCGTAAAKYFLRDLFRIPTVDADDADAEPDRPAAVAPIAERPVAQPPVNPQTGEISPHHIARDNLNARQWGQQFIGALESAKTRDELEEWISLNVLELRKIEGENKADVIDARLKARIDDFRKKFTIPDGRGTNSTQAAPALHGVPTPILEQLKLCRTKRALEQVWREHAAQIEALEEGTKAAFTIAFHAHEKRVAALN